MALKYGLLDPAKRERACATLRAAAKGGQPTSLGRLLIAEGHAPEVVAAVLASGEAASAILCDACGAARAQAELRERGEVPCLRCGSLLLGFRVFAKPPTRRVSGATQRYSGVLEIPQGEDPNDATSPYGVIIPTPGAAPCAAFNALLEADTTNAASAASLVAQDEFAAERTLAVSPPPGAQVAPAVERTLAVSPPPGAPVAPAVERTLAVSPPPGAPVAPMAEATLAVSPPQGPSFASQEELARLASVDPEDEGGETFLDPGALGRIRAPRGLAPGEPLSPQRPPPQAAAPEPRGALWPLCLILLLLITISALGLYKLLTEA